MIHRSSIPARLTQKFMKDYNSVMFHYTIEQQIELTKYLLDLFSYYLNEEKTADQTKQINDQLESIKKKYGKNFRAYRNARLNLYFHFDIVLAEKDIYSVEEYNKLEDQILSEKERNSFLTACSNGLQHSLDEIYLKSEPEENQLSLSAVEKNKSKGKRPRESGDNLTKLNQEQTALLFQYLRKGQLIFKDESLLNNKQAGVAISILTGYSSGTSRQDFSKAEFEQIATKKNLTDLFNAIISLSILIDKDLKGKK